MATLRPLQMAILENGAAIDFAVSPALGVSAIDRDGNVVDSLLSEHRDLDASKRFFNAALDVAG